MTRDEARQEIRRNWRTLISSMTSPAKRKANGETSWICPICGHGSHGDGLTKNKKSADGNGLHCFGCGFTGDIIDLEMKRTGADYNRAFSLLADEMGLQIDSGAPGGEWKKIKGQQDTPQAPQSGFDGTDDKKTDKQEKTAAGGAEVAEKKNYKEYYINCALRRNDPAAVAYLEGRGMSPGIISRYNIGYDPQADPASNPGGTGTTRHPAPRIIIPVNTGHYIARAIDPDTPKQYQKMNPAGSTPGIFNRGKALYKSDAQEVFIVEGVFDALSLLEVGAEAIALNSIANTDKLIKVLQEKPATKDFIICLDNETDPKKKENVEKAIERLCNGLQQLNIFYTVGDICGSFHDANDRLQKDREGLQAAVNDAIEKCREAKTAAPEPIEESQEEDTIDSFLSAIYTERYKPVKTGIAALDNALGGGFISQTLICLGAEPAAGKTILAAMIFEAMAKQGHPALYFNLEMSREQLIARSLARIVYENDHSHKLTALDILQGYRQTDETKKLVLQAAQQYRETIAPNLEYNPGKTGTGVTEILQCMEEKAKAATAAGKPAPNVCIDYLQIMTGEGREDAAEIIKRAVAGLKDYARKYNAIVFCIMAQSRMVNNRGEATLSAGRDSSNIEYGTDTQLQMLRKDEKKPDNITLYVTKSRFTKSSLKDGIYLKMHGAQSYFEVLDHDPASLNFDDEIEADTGFRTVGKTESGTIERIFDGRL